jgi:hypothetical protein
MRLFELLYEAKPRPIKRATRPNAKPTINTTALRNSLKREINSQMLDSTHQMYYKEPKLDPEIKAEENRENNLSKTPKIVAGWLEKDLSVRVAAGIADIINAYTDLQSKVEFTETKVGGSASGINMEISDNRVKALTKEIVECMYSYTLDTLENKTSIVETFFMAFKKADVRTLYSGNLENELDRLVSVVLHELTHIIQHSAQYKQDRKGPTEYRSYLEPDKTKFNAVINKMHKGEELTPYEYKIYRASPQEIPAFAQEAALGVLNDLDIDNVTDLKELRKLLPDNIRAFMDHQFNNPSNAKEYAVFKKFHKLMYQEIMRYVDMIEKKRIRQNRKV